MVTQANSGMVIPELKNVMVYDAKIFKAINEIVSGCLIIDPAKRWTAKQVHNKLQALCKTLKIANPEPSPEYSEKDFAPFFAYIAKKKGKSEDTLFSKHKKLLQMLGSIPIALKKKVDLKSLPFVDEITDKKGVKFMY